MIHLIRPDAMANIAIVIYLVWRRAPEWPRVSS